MIVNKLLNEGSNRQYFSNEELTRRVILLQEILVIFEEKFETLTKEKLYIQATTTGTKVISAPF